METPGDLSTLLFWKDKILSGDILALKRYLTRSLSSHPTDIVNSLIFPLDKVSGHTVGILQLAVEWDSESFLNVILNYAKTSEGAPLSTFYTPLQSACRYKDHAQPHLRFGNQRIVEALLRARADPHRSAGGGPSPLALAVMNNHYDNTGLLLRHGARLPSGEKPCEGI